VTVFRRRRRDSDRQDEAAPSDDSLTEEIEPEPPAVRPSAERPNGPWDVSELEAPGEHRVDLGGVLIPATPETELRVEVADERIVAATVILGEGALQIQPFAAPRTTGIWSEVRQEIAAGITQQGGTVDETEGTFGSELRARVPVRTPDGQPGMQVARFVGVDGPRWFLRGVFTGAAVEPGSASQLEEIFRQTVVVRGDDPMAPRDPITLTLPAQPAGEPVAGSDEAGPEPGLNPFERGPEITEIR
jgi:hypothetical protein